MISIAIDGPSSAGKSTMAKFIANELGYIYVDTGALYRCVGLYCVENGIETTDAQAVTAALPHIEVTLQYVNGEQRMFLGQRDVSYDIRRPEMSMAASNVSAIPKVREFLFDLQRDFAKTNNVVMDGRDIGTVVLPDAQVKIYLTATAEERANRRYKDHQARGEQIDYQTLLQDILQRDYNDSSRAVAPLKQADDAILVDTTEISLEQTKQQLLALIEKRLAQRQQGT